MRASKIIGAFIVGVGCSLSLSMVLVSAISGPTIHTQVMATESLSATLSQIKEPEVPEPVWLQRQKATRTVTYTVATRGVITADMSEFKADANETLNDPRGWAAMGVRFEEVSSGGMFTLVLSEASQIPTFSSVCDAGYSCTVGNYVAINQDRWLGATPPWNQAGKSLRDYRSLVINHETGHWLGHPDTNTCSGAGQPAPVMAQQSIYASSCVFNPWPLANELWSTRLGVTV